MYIYVFVPLLNTFMSFIQSVFLFNVLWQQLNKYSTYFYFPNFFVKSYNFPEIPLILLKQSKTFSPEMLQPNEDTCRDSISVTEGSKQLLHRCGETNRPISITSEGHALNVTLTATSNVYPKRGYVAHFQGRLIWFAPICFVFHLTNGKFALQIFQNNHHSM